MTEEEFVDNLRSRFTDGHSSGELFEFIANNIFDLEADLMFARFFAVAAHGEQRYGILPYSHHLQAVEQVLRRFGVSDKDDLQAAWLHDIVEDTHIKLRDIEENFSDETTRLVGAVTSEPGPNRKTRNALTYPKIRAAGPRAVRLKLADRIANMESGGKALSMYQNEYPEFRHALYTRGDNVEMWARLDELSKFKVVARAIAGEAKAKVSE